VRILARLILDWQEACATLSEESRLMLGEALIYTAVVRLMWPSLPRA
jgi:hypothetical protein